MKKMLCMMCVLIPLSIHCSEAEGKEQKKMATLLSSSVNHDGRRKRTLITMNAQEKVLKTTVTFAQDGKTVQSFEAYCDDDVSRDDLLRLIGLQNAAHVGLTIGLLEKLTNSVAINTDALKL